MKTWVDEQIDSASEEIRRELRDPGGKHLRIPGLEQVLVDIATKIVVGVVVGLVNKLLLDRWAAAKTKKEIEELKRDVILLKQRAEPADATTIQRAIEGELTRQGVPAENAVPIATRVIGSVQKALPRTLGP